MAKRVISALAALGLMILGSRAEASVVIDILQDGPNVVATGSGTVDLTDLTYRGGAGSTPSGEVVGKNGAVEVGAGRVILYSGVSGPDSFGTGSASGSSGSGDTFGLIGDAGALLVPNGYSSGSALSGSSTFDSATIASLGLTPGRYVYTWGSKASADSLTVNIGTVPELPTWAMMIAGLSILGALYRRRATVAA
jgi:hypothetical protein